MLRHQANKPADDSAGHPGNSWAAGIQEVSLSIDFKLKNIERTEAAKKALLEESAKRANIKVPTGHRFGSTVHFGTTG